MAHLDTARGLESCQCRSDARRRMDAVTEGFAPVTGDWEGSPPREQSVTMLAFCRIRLGGIV